MSSDAEAREVRRLLLIAVLVLLFGEGGLAAIAFAKESKPPKQAITTPTLR